MLTILQKLYQAEKDTVISGESLPYNKAGNPEGGQLAQAGATLGTRPLEEFAANKENDKQFNQLVEELNQLRDKAINLLHASGHTENWVLQMLRTALDIFAANGFVKEAESLNTEIQAIEASMSKRASANREVSEIDEKIKNLNSNPKITNKEKAKQMTNLNMEKQKQLDKANGYDQQITDRLSQINQTKAYYERQSKSLFNLTTPIKDANLYTKKPKIISSKDALLPGYTLGKTILETVRQTALAPRGDKLKTAAANLTKDQASTPPELLDEQNATDARLNRVRDRH